MLRKAKPGEPLRIPASTFNAFIDTANIVNRKKITVDMKSKNRPGIILVKNISGEAYDKYDVFGLGDNFFDPTIDDTQFESQVILEGDIPDTDLHMEKWAIALEPIEDDDIGVAMISGCLPIELKINDSDHLYADIEDGEKKLQTTIAGSAKILWVEDISSGSSGDTGYAIIQFPISPRGTAIEPYELPAGTDGTADDEVWDIDDQPEGYDGVNYKPIRMYWSGNSGDEVYLFVRSPTYNSYGRLVAVSAEIKTSMFDTDTC